MSNSCEKAYFIKCYSYTIIFGIAIYLALFLVNSLTRQGALSPDSMNYIDIARNISRGKGIVQSTAVMESCGGILKPMPMTAQPPLYPILIAAASFCGLSCLNAGFVISTVAYGLIFIFVYLLAKDLWGKPAALMSIACLLFYAPLRQVARFAWTEPIAAVFLLCSLLLLLKIPKLEKTTLMIGISLAAGLLTGLSFATRYALFPLYFLGVIFLMLELKNGKRGIQSLVPYSIGFCAIVFLVFAHNKSACGLFLPASPPSDRALLLNLKDSIFATMGNWLLVGKDIKIQVAADGLLLIVFVIIMSVRRIQFQVLSTALIAKRRYLCFVWVILYSVFIVCWRTINHFDIINYRITFLSDIILVILFAGFFSSITGEIITKRYFIASMVVMLIFVRIILEIRCTSDNGTCRVKDLAQTERLCWIARNTTANDLVIAENAVDIPLFLGREIAVSFSAYPYTKRIEYPALIKCIRKNCNRYRNVYIIACRHGLSSNQLAYSYGTFIADLAFGHIEKYEYIVPRGHLSDASIYSIRSGLLEINSQ